MERKKASVVSLLILFVIVFLCVVVFALLSAAPARANLRVAQKYGAHITECYACETAGYETAMRAAETVLNGGSQLPEGCEQSGNELTVTTRRNGIECVIRMDLQSGKAEIIEKTIRTDWQIDDSMNLWS